MRSFNLLSGLIAVTVSAAAMAQSAVLHDGRVVNMVIPQETFSVEGPSWNIDLANRQVICTGYAITIPASLNGEPFLMGGTQIVNGEEVRLGEITSATFDRLLDLNAATRDRVFDTNGAAGTIRLGPARSLFSVSESRSAAVSNLVRSPTTQKQIEDNYFFLARNAFAQYPPGILPANFLGLIGIRTETGAFPTSNNQLPPRRFWRYPSMGGATFMAQGSVYADAQGNRFNIPDFPVKGYLATLILAENVCIGNLRAAAVGNFQTPDSYVVGNTLIMMNQDPRMPMDILGIANSPVSREYFSQAAQPGLFVATVGHMIGEHVMMGEAIDVSAALFDPALGAWVSVIDRTWGFRAGQGLSFRGDVVPASSTDLFYQFGRNGVFAGPEISLQSQLIVDPVLDTARFDIRNLAGADPTNTPQIRFTVRSNNGNRAVLRQVTYDWAAILGL